jgi:hypothetical protein
MKEQKPSVGLSAEPGVDAIQWTVARLFEVSLHDLIFGSTTLKINDYPRQLALARMGLRYKAHGSRPRAARHGPDCSDKTYPC